MQLCSETTLLHLALQIAVAVAVVLVVAMVATAVRVVLVLQYLDIQQMQAYLYQSVTCVWKPSVHGRNTLSATITSSTYAGYSGSFASTALTGKRTGGRS